MKDMGNFFKIRLFIIILGLFPFALVTNFYMLLYLNINLILHITINIALISVYLVLILGKIYISLTEIYKASQQVAKGSYADLTINENGYFNSLAISFNKMLNEIDRHKAEMEKLSFQDHLTGLSNRRMLDLSMQAQINQSERTELPLSLLAIDIDDFKQINDTHGHLFGDTVIAEVASILNTSLRRSDMTARFGGEEFVVLLPNTNLINATKVAEKLRKEISHLRFQSNNRLISISVTIGAASLDQVPTNLSIEKKTEALLNKADIALYSGKESGKNKVSSSI
ncbi:GGDEF domain-containing protein [Proteinivorax hydrogeniformans]|uniref:GGDEF domain-containing protein n=1 Tax=Proteinivorax hydrogeniformans TaxID=1826727 RepID=A0AAU8HVV5_9FIRM